MNAAAIYGNDDEYEETIAPLLLKLQSVKKKHFPKHGKWAFLRKWTSPMTEDNLEVITEPGKKDARLLGKRLRELYPNLFPPADFGKKGKKGQEKPETPFKVSVNAWP